MNHDIHATRRDLRAVLADVVEDTCSESDCKMTILVDKNDKALGRKSRCMSCLVREKVRTGIIRP